MLLSSEESPQKHKPVQEMRTRKDGAFEEFFRCPCMLFVVVAMVAAMISCTLLVMSWGNKQALDVRKVLWTDAEMLKFLQSNRPKVVNHSVSSTSIFSEKDRLGQGRIVSKGGSNMPGAGADAGTSSNDKAQKEMLRFNVQKIVWMFQQQQSQQLSSSVKLLHRMNSYNNKHLANMSQYTVITLSVNSFTQHLSNTTAQSISALISLLKQQVSSQQHPQQPLTHEPLNESTYNQIVKRLIVYAVLMEKGGVFVDVGMTLVEPVHQWLEDILDNPMVNVGNRTSYIRNGNKKCFGFFHQEYSSRIVQLDIQREYIVEKQVIMFPSLEDYFIACQKGSQLMKKLFLAYQDILVLSNHAVNLSSLNKNQELIGKTSPDLTYTHGHRLALHYILQQKQYQLLSDKSLPNLSERPNSPEQEKAKQLLAIDSLGLITMNELLGPKKLSFSFKDPGTSYYKAFEYAAKFTVDQLQFQVGKLRYGWVFNPQTTDQMYNWLFKQETDIRFVDRRSFVGQFLLRLLKDEEQRQYIEEHLPLFYQSYMERLTREESPEYLQFQNSLEYANTKNPSWESLGKHVWVIWDSGIRGKSSLMVELCYENLKKRALQSGFEMHAVSQQSIKKLLDPPVLEKINKALSNANYEVSKQAVTDLWRLALIHKYGGVYLDVSTFEMTDSFDWLKNITRIPSTYLWNRYGSEPEVLMFFNGYYASPLEWKVDKEKQFKVQWHLSYENNFIAAAKGSKLIEEWLDLFLEWIQVPYTQIQRQMKEVSQQVYDNRWTSQQSRYLLAMDSIKYVIARRQFLLEKEKIVGYADVSDFYKLWSISGQMIGQQKLRAETNFQNSDYRLGEREISLNNIYKYKRSLDYVEEVLGPITYQTKFFSLDLYIMNQKLMEYYESRARNISIDQLAEVVHPRSMIGRQLLLQNPQRTLFLLQHYANSTDMRLKWKGLNKLML